MLNRPLGKTGKISFSGTSTLFSQECSGIQNLLTGLSHHTLGLCRDDWMCFNPSPSSLATFDLAHASIASRPSGVFVLIGSPSTPPNPRCPKPALVLESTRAVLGRAGVGHVFPGLRTHHRTGWRARREKAGRHSRQSRRKMRKVRKTYPAEEKK